MRVKRNVELGDLFGPAAEELSQADQKLAAKQALLGLD
jgi:hypothetical protein